MPKSNAQIILGALMRGSIISIKDHPDKGLANREFALSEDNSFCVVMDRYEIKDGEKNLIAKGELHEIDMSLKLFLNACNQISQDDMFEIVANVTLAEFNLQSF